MNSYAYRRKHRDPVLLASARVVHTASMEGQLKCSKHAKPDALQYCNAPGFYSFSVF